MGNPITDNIKIGTLGELLIQIRFLEHDIQAAPPIKDSGNDLIAIKGESCRFIQVKTTTKTDYRINKSQLPDCYHILAIVKLKPLEYKVLLDESEIYLIPREKIENISPSEYNNYILSDTLINELFSN